MPPVFSAVYLRPFLAAVAMLPCRIARLAAGLRTIGVITTCQW